MTAAPEKILCIQQARIGDVLLTTPALRALAQHYKTAQIDCLVNQSSRQVLAHNPYISNLRLLPESNQWLQWCRLLLALKKADYTKVVDFVCLPKTGVIAWMTRASTRVGYAFRNRSFFYTQTIPPNFSKPYSVYHKLSLLNCLGVNSTNIDLDFYPNPGAEQQADQLLQSVHWDAQKTLICVSPASRQKYKVWPAKYFATVCDQMLKNPKNQILFLYGPGEQSFAEQVQNNMQHQALGFYQPPNISTVFCLLKRAQLYIGNDNGLTHFAIAAKTRTVTIFGRPLAENWTPPNQTRYQSLDHDPGCKHNCVYPNCKIECLNHLKPDLVIEKAEQQLQWSTP